VKIRHDSRCYFNVRSKANMCQLNLPHGSGKWKMRPSVEKSGGRPPPAPLHPCMMCIQYTDWLETSSPSRMSSSVIAMLNDALYAAPATELALLHALAPAAASTFLYCRSKYDWQRSLVYHTDHPPLHTARRIEQRVVRVRLHSLRLLQPSSTSLLDYKRP